MAKPIEKDTVFAKNHDEKVRFLEYFAKVPIQKFAAAHIGKSEDTITDWKKADPLFSDCIERAKAAFVLQKMNTVRSSEWILERIFKGDFAQRNEHTGEGGEPIKFESLNDEQLDRTIESKLRKVGIGIPTTGAGKENE